MIITKRALPRRTFLRGMMGATMALPLLEAMVPAATPLAKTAAKPPVPSQKPVASALAQDTTQTANAPASGATTTPTP